MEARKLTAFQRRFCHKVALEGMKRSDAVVACGWKGKIPKDKASKMMMLPHIREYIQKLELDALEREKLTHAAILGDIVKVKDRCMQAEPVLDNEGEAIGEYTFKEHGALKALELLGKYKRLWNDAAVVAPIGPGLTVIVQQGVQVQGQQSLQTHRVEVQLPKPGQP